MAADTPYKKTTICTINQCPYDKRLVAILKDQNECFIFNNSHGPTLNMILTNITDQEPFLVPKKTYGSMLMGAINSIAHTMTLPSQCYYNPNTGTSLNGQRSSAMKHHYELLRDGLITYLYEQYLSNYAPDAYYICNVGILARYFKLPEELCNKLICYADHFLYKMPKIDALLMLRYANTGERYASWLGHTDKAKIQVQLPEPLDAVCRCEMPFNTACEEQCPHGIHRIG